MGWYYKKTRLNFSIQSSVWILSNDTREGLIGGMTLVKMKNLVETLKIGVVGFSRERYDKKEAIENITLLISKMISIHKPKEVEIVIFFLNLIW